MEKYTKSQGNIISDEDAIRRKSDNDYLNRRYYGSKWSLPIIIFCVCVYYIAILEFSYGNSLAAYALCIGVIALAFYGYYRYREFNKPPKKETPEEWANRLEQYIKSKSKQP